MIRLIKKFNQGSLAIQGFISFISMGLYVLSSGLLEKYYALSKFPVPYFVQQTSFNATKLKEWYAFMLNQNTFTIYIKTQFIDFLFIATVILAGFTIWSFVANFHSKQSFFYKWGHKLAFALPLAGLFDILENLVSFFMIAKPNDFSNFLVLPYSTFASIKFGFWTIALLWILISLIALPVSKLFLSKK
jgi:hypothetical protein